MCGYARQPFCRFLLYHLVVILCGAPLFKWRFHSLLVKYLSVMLWWKNIFEIHLCHYNCLVNQPSILQHHSTNNGVAVRWEPILYSLVLLHSAPLDFLHLQKHNPLCFRTHLWLFLLQITRFSFGKPFVNFILQFFWKPFKYVISEIGIILLPLFMLDNLSS